MRYDINIDLVVSVEAEDQAAAEEQAARMAGQLQDEAEYAFSSVIRGLPRPLAAVSGVEPVRG